MSRSGNVDINCLHRHDPVSLAAEAKRQIYNLPFLTAPSLFTRATLRARLAVIDIPNT